MIVDLTLVTNYLNQSGCQSMKITHNSLVYLFMACQQIYADNISASSISMIVTLSQKIYCCSSYCYCSSCYCFSCLVSPHDNTQRTLSLMVYRVGGCLSRLRSFRSHSKMIRLTLIIICLLSRLVLILFVLFFIKAYFLLIMTMVV